MEIFHSLLLFISTFLAHVSSQQVPSHVPLADFHPDSKYLYNSLYVDHINATRDACLQKEGCLLGPGTRKVIRFGSMIWNLGTGDAILGAVPDWVPEDVCSDSTEEVKQGPFYFDRCHKHWHFQGYARYTLYKVINTTLLPFTKPVDLLRANYSFQDNLQQISQGHKRGFCLEDSICPPSTSPKFTCGMQGVSVGCADVYWDKLPCQWIDVEDLEPTSDMYVMEIWVNHDESIPELDFGNNRALVPFLWSTLPVRATDEWEIPPSGVVCPL
jgi:hypothetical protein